MSEEQWTREREAFLSLPRLAGRLTAELILRSPQGLDPCQDYAIDLRGEPSTERHKSSINPPSPAFAVCPGCVDTEITRRAADEIAARGQSTADEAFAALAAMNRIGRMHSVEEVASAVADLVRNRPAGVVLDLDRDPPLLSD